MHHLIIAICNTQNLEAAKTLIKLLLEHDSNYDFTTFFLNGAKSDAVEICNYLLEENNNLNYEQLSDNFSDFRFFNVELFETLINRMNPYERKNCCDCLNSAITRMNKDLVKYILKDNPPSHSSLLAAISTKDLELVELILEKNSQPSFINKVEKNGTPLHFAVHSNNLEIVQKFLDLPGINPSLYSYSGRTPLIDAIKNNKTEIANAILDFYGDNIKEQKSQIYSALNVFLTASKSSLENQILDRLIDIKDFDHNYLYVHTLLTFSCENNKIDYVRKLLKYEDIDVNLYEIQNGNTPLIIAVKNNNYEIAKLLIEHPQTDVNRMNFSDQSPLIFAVLRNNVRILDLIIQSDKFDPEESNVNYAFFVSTGEISKKLISIKSLNVNKASNNNNNKDTSLVDAVIKSDIEKIDLIINHPSFNKDESKINKAIIESFKGDKLSIFNKLMKSIDNDLNSIKIDGQNIISYCVKNLNDTMLKEILNNKSFESKKIDTLSLFIQSFSSLYRSHIDEINAYDISPIIVMKELYNYDQKHDHLIDLNKLLDDGHSFFTYPHISESYIHDVFYFFLENGADPNKPDLFGDYPLQRAIENHSYTSALPLIISNKIDYSIKMKNASTYLHLAAEMDSDILKLILDKNVIDINAVDSFGNTPLLIACHCLKLQSVVFLFKDEKLDFLHRNNDGKDALGIIGIESTTKDKNEYFNVLISAMQDKFNAIHSINELKRTPEDKNKKKQSKYNFYSTKNNEKKPIKFTFCSKKQDETQEDRDNTKKPEETQKNKDNKNSNEEKPFKFIFNSKKTEKNREEEEGKKNNEEKPFGFSFTSKKQQENIQENNETAPHAFNFNFKKSERTQEDKDDKSSNEAKPFNFSFNFNKQDRAQEDKDNRNSNEAAPFNFSFNSKKPEKTQEEEEGKKNNEEKQFRFTFTSKKQHENIQENNETAPHAFNFNFKKSEKTQEDKDDKSSNEAKPFNFSFNFNKQEGAQEDKDSVKNDKRKELEDKKEPNE